MAQKVIEGGVVTWRHMHVTLRWLNFKLAQNLRSRVKTPRWLTFSDQKLWDSSNSERNSIRDIDSFEFWAISEFEVWKCDPSRSFDTWSQILGNLEVEPSQNLMHMPPRDNTSFDDFLSHLKDPRVLQSVECRFFLKAYFRCHQKLKICFGIF